MNNDHEPAKSDPQIGITCEGCDYFNGKCFIQAETNRQLKLDLALTCKTRGIIFVNKTKKDYNNTDIAMIVYRALKKDQIHPVFPHEIVKNISQLLSNTNDNVILIERFYASPIGTDLRRLERHLGSIGGNV